MDADAQQVLRQQHAGIAVAHHQRGESGTCLKTLHAEPGSMARRCCELLPFHAGGRALRLAFQDGQRGDRRRGIGRREADAEDEARRQVAQIFDQAAVAR